MLATFLIEMFFWRYAATIFSRRSTEYDQKINAIAKQITGSGVKLFAR
ncbi:MAG: hypothetical protein V7K38_27835 [Nostoc sp.]